MSNVTKVGLLSVAAIIIFILGFSFLKGNKLFKTQNSYFAVFEKVDGLYSSDPVYVSGYQIGKVSDLELNFEDELEVVVTLDIDENIKIPNNSTAILYSADFLGEKSIKLILGDSKEFYQPGDTVNTNVEKELIGQLESQITPITDKVNDLVIKLDTFMAYISPLFDARSETNIHETVDLLNKNLDIIKDKTAAIDTQIISENLKRFDRIMANFENDSKKISHAIDNFSDLSDTLVAIGIKDAVEQTKNSIAELEKLLKSINEGEGTISAMINEREVYDNIEKATKSLDDLLTDLQENPKRYVHFSLFGAKDKDKKKEEEKEDLD